MPYQYLITIDRSSIKRNPNYGKTRIPFRGRSSLYAIFTNEIPKSLKDKFEVVDIATAGFDDEMVELGAHGIGNPIELQKELLNLPHNQRPRKVEITANVLDVECCNPPQYLYEYLPVTVQCYMCDVSFLHTALEDDYNDYCDYTSTDTKCPNCKEWDCVELTYEDLTKDLIKQTGH